MLSFPSTPCPQRRRRGFTFLELLVVLAIVAVLLGILLPTIQQGRTAAVRISSSHERPAASRLHFTPSRTSACHTTLPRTDAKHRVLGYGECSRCSCPGFFGFSSTCDRSGCGHHYDDHY